MKTTPNQPKQEGKWRNALSLTKLVGRTWNDVNPINWITTDPRAEKSLCEVKNELTILPEGRV